MDDGARTRDFRHHKPALYQLSYAHHAARVPAGPPEVYRVGQPSTDAANAALTCVAAAWASSDVGPGSGVNTVAR